MTEIKKTQANTPSDWETSPVKTQPSPEKQKQFFDNIAGFIEEYTNRAKFNRDFGNLVGMCGIILSILVPFSATYNHKNSKEITAILGVGAAICQALHASFPFGRRYLLYSVATAKAEKILSFVNFEVSDFTFESAVQDFYEIRMKTIAEEPLNEFYQNQKEEEIIPKKSNGVNG